MNFMNRATGAGRDRPRAEWPRIWLDCSCEEARRHTLGGSRHADVRTEAGLGLLRASWASQARRCETRGTNRRHDQVRRGQGQQRNGHTGSSAESGRHDLVGGLHDTEHAGVPAVTVSPTGWDAEKIKPSRPDRGGHGVSVMAGKQNGHETDVTTCSNERHGSCCALGAGMAVTASGPAGSGSSRRADGISG